MKRGWKDKILFAMIQRYEKIKDGLQKIKRYKTASKTYTTETAHEAERMHACTISSDNSNHYIYVCAQLTKPTRKTAKCRIKL